mgnify:CR=1 FL=1
MAGTMFPLAKGVNLSMCAISVVMVVLLFTIENIDDKANYSAAELYERTCAAVELLKDKKKARKFIKKIMSTDFSWAASAKQYISMYDSLN